MGAAIRAHDWSASALGDPAHWPLALRTTVEVMTSSRFPMFCAWGPELSVLYNDAYAPFLGLRHGRALGRPIREVWADVWPDIEPLAAQALAGEATWAEDTHLVMTRNGVEEDTWWTFSYSPLRDDAGVIRGFLDLVSDTTAKVLNERRLRATMRDLEDFTRLALTSVGGVGAWTYDAASDCFVCDEAVSALYGIDPVAGAAGIPRTGFLANVHPDDRAALAATMSGGLKRSGDLELEYRIRHADGSIRWVLSRGHTYHEDGQPVRRTGVAIDTTRQHQLEEQLRQSQKMEAVGQLTGGIAHDFNNLLTGITGSLEMIQNRVAQGRIEAIDRYIAAAQGAAKRAAALTHRLLAFSRRQTLDPKATDVNGLIAGMEELVRRSVGPEVSITVAGAAGLWSTRVDPNQLENALLNLCINARDAMPGGGAITITTANRTLDEPGASERDLPPGQYVTLSVADTGTGMTPEVIARAFDPFFTTKPIGAGTGLGLSMIYGFARQSGGQVRIASAVGDGTTITLYLPRNHAEPQAGEDETAADPDQIAGEGEVVLVIEDEPTIRMLIAEVLEEFGYACIEASDGALGLGILQSGARIDLLITDVGLPGGLNGRQIADAARALRPDLKVLFITGYAENAVVGGEDLDPGMQVMTKPFGMDALAARIRTMIEG